MLIVYMLYLRNLIAQLSYNFQPDFIYQKNMTLRTDAPRIIVILSI